MKYLKKIFFILKNIKNPGLFTYLIFHYLKRNVPISIANRFSKEADGCLNIKSYDGSNQHVHPDIVRWRNELWLVTTPYPFGMEEYENPCVYHGLNFNRMKECASNPIDKPDFQKIGYHMSDPCLFIFEENLECIYRETIRRKNYSENRLLVKKYLGDDLWTDKQLVFESETDELISPAIVVYNGQIHMFHINNIDHNTIVHSVYDKDWNLIQKNLQKCDEVPEGYYVWHVGISGRDNKLCSDSSILKGVFTLKSERNRTDFILCIFKSDIFDNKWNFKSRINLDINQLNIKFPYKSCFIPDTDMVLISFRSNDDRYRLYVRHVEDEIRV